MLKMNKDVVCMEQRYSLGYQSGAEEENYDLLFWSSELQSHWAQPGTAVNSDIHSKAVDFCVYIVKLPCQGRMFSWLDWEK